MPNRRVWFVHSGGVQLGRHAVREREQVLLLARRREAGHAEVAGDAAREVQGRHARRDALAAGPVGQAQHEWHVQDRIEQHLVAVPDLRRVAAFAQGLAVVRGDHERRVRAEAVGGEVRIEARELLVGVAHAGLVEEARVCLVVDAEQELVGLGVVVGADVPLCDLARGDVDAVALGVVRDPVRRRSVGCVGVEQVHPQEAGAVACGVPRIQPVGDLGHCDRAVLGGAGLHLEVLIEAATETQVARLQVGHVTAAAVA